MEEVVLVRLFVADLLEPLWSLTSIGEMFRTGTCGDVVLETEQYPTSDIVRSRPQAFRTVKRFETGSTTMYEAVAVTHPCRLSLSHQP